MASICIFFNYLDSKQPRNVHDPFHGFLKAVVEFGGSLERCISVRECCSLQEHDQVKNGVTMLKAPCQVLPVNFVLFAMGF